MSAGGGEIQKTPAGPPEAPGEPHKAYTASRGNIHAWGASGVAQYFMWKEYDLIQPVFTMGFGIDSRWIGWAMFFPRLFDAFVDPFVGHLSDISHTRMGRRRPFMLVSAILGAVFAIMLYQLDPLWPGAAKFAYLMVAVTLYFSVYSAYEMSRAALSYELSDDYNARSKIQAIGNVWFTVPQLVGSYSLWYIWSLAEGRHVDLGFFAFDFPNLGSKVSAARAVAVAGAIIIVVFAVIPTVLVKERFQNVNRRHVRLWQAIRTTMKNRAFVVVVVLRIAETLGTTLYGLMSTFILTFHVFGGSVGEYSFVIKGGGAWLGLANNILLVYLAIPLTRWLGKRKGIIFGYAMSLLYCATLPFITRPGWGWVLIIHMFLFIPLTALKGLFMQSIMPDICDVDELQSGERREGLYSAVMSFINKVEGSVCNLLGGYMLAWAGFDSVAVTNGIKPGEDVIRNMLWLGFTPQIFFAAAAVVIVCFIPLTPQVMDRVRAELDKRHAAAGIAGPSQP